MFLRGGAWQGRQLVPAGFVDAATHKQVAGGWPWPAWVEYGYLWWLLPGRGSTAPSYAANGFGGQYIWVMPAFDAVVVITANPFESNDTSRVALEYIIPAFGGP